MVTFGDNVINSKDFYIEKKWNGMDELVMEISVEDELYPYMVEETKLSYDGQDYLIKAIDRGIKKATIKAQIDLDEWRTRIWIPYRSGSKELYDIVEDVAPDGWTVFDLTGITTKRSITMNSATPLEAVMKAVEEFHVVPQFNISNKTIMIWNPDDKEPLGAFIMEDLNLQSLTFKGNSTGFATRLYCYGKDDITFASINDGKPYVEDFSYANKVICAYWKDERYTDPQSLLEDGMTRIKSMAVPLQSYSCQVTDLAKTNPDLYGFQDFSLMQKVQLCDRITNRMVTHQIVQVRTYPYYPEKNIVTLSTLPPSVASEVAAIKETVKTLPSTSMMEQAIKEATDMLTRRVTEGNVVDLYDINNHRYGIAFMDTDDPATAQNVWLFSANGWGYSSNGLNGPYTIAATMNGAIVADMVKAGTLQGVRIIAESGEIGGFTISEHDLTIDFTYNYPTFTSEDLTKVQNYILQQGTLTDEEKRIYDVNKDGAINSADLLVMQRMINGTVDTYSSGTIKISSEDTDAIITTEIKSGYGAGKKTVIGIGGIQTTGAVKAKFVSGDEEGLSSTVIDTFGTTFDVTGGLITSSRVNQIGNVNSTYQIASTNLSATWANAAQMTLAAGTWLVFYSGAITGPGSLSIGLYVGNVLSNRQSVHGDQASQYDCEACAVITLAAQSTVSMQAQSPDVQTLLYPRMYAVRIK